MPPVQPAPATPRRPKTVSLKDSATMRELHAGGTPLEEITAQFADTYSPRAIERAATHTAPSNETRDAIFYSIIAGQYYSDIAERLGITEGQVRWVARFYLPAESRGLVASLTRTGMPIEQIFKRLSDSDKAISKNSVALAVKLARWEEMKRNQRAGRAKWSPETRESRARQKAANPDVVFRQPDTSMDKPADTETFEVWTQRRMRRLAIIAGSAT